MVDMSRVKCQFQMYYDVMDDFLNEVDKLDPMYRSFVYFEPVWPLKLNLTGNYINHLYNIYFTYMIKPEHQVMLRLKFNVE